MEQMQRSSDNRMGNDVTVDTLKSDISQLATTVQKLAKEQLGTAAGQMQDQATQTVSDLEATIRRNPTQAAAIAAGAGFLLGLVMTR